MLAKALLDDLLYRFLNPFISSTQKVCKVNRKIISKLNLENIKEILSRMASGERLDSAFLKHGINLPTSEQEANGLLG